VSVELNTIRSAVAAFAHLLRVGSRSQFQGASQCPLDILSTE